MPHTSFFKNVFNVFWRLTGYHVMAMFVTISVLAFLPDILGGVIAQFIDLGIIIILPYLTVWKWGDSDCNKIAHDRIMEDKFLGLKVGFAAYSPYLLLGLSLILAKIGLLPDTILSWYRFIFSPFLAFNQSLMPTTLMLTEQSYLSVISSVALLFTVPLSMGLAYYMGINRISFSETFGFSKHDKVKL